MQAWVKSHHHIALEWKVFGRWFYDWKWSQREVQLVSYRNAIKKLLAHVAPFCIVIFLRHDMLRWLARIHLPDLAWFDSGKSSLADPTIPISPLKQRLTANRSHMTFGSQIHPKAIPKQSSDIKGRALVWCFIWLAQNGFFWGSWYIYIYYIVRIYIYG